jgi:HlyD family secretion protein
MTRHSTLRVALTSIPLLAAAVTIAFWGRSAAEPALVAAIRRGTLTATLTTSGTLKPIQSITYRSPLAGRETEIVELVGEGTRVREGDLLVRFDTTDLERDIARAKQEVAQARMDLVVAEIERKEAEAAVKGVAEGEGALAVEEAKTRLQLAEKKVDRLREEHDQLKPLLDNGFITREELKKTVDELEQAEEDLALAKKRADVVIGLNHPRDTQHAALQLAQRESQLENTRIRALEADARLQLLLAQLEHCRVVARRPGLVVYEEFLNANPRRKVRVGDRVSASQGVITIPEVNRMLLEASVSEAEVHRVHAGQAASIRVEAFPGEMVSGTVARVGTLARASADRPFDEKRFDLIIDVAPTDLELRPEMTARGDITVGTRANVLLAPVNAVFDDKGVTVVHLRRGGAVETRAVRVGEGNDTAAEILSGVAEGDELMLTAPAAPVTAGGSPRPISAPGPGPEVAAVAPKSR